MTSLVTLFKTRLDESKRWKLDDMVSYLASCESKAINGDKYVLPRMTMTVDLPFNEKYVLANFGYNYLSIKQSDGSTYYYFITNTEWRGAELITLTLKLDTLNFPMYEPVFTDKTRIIREHQDRWGKSGAYYYPIVDKYAEGLECVKNKLRSEVFMNYGRMYLIQISKNATTPDTVDTHPYDTYVCYDNSIQFAPAGTTTGDSTLLLSTTKCYAIVEGTLTYTNTNVGNGTYSIGEPYTQDGVTAFIRAFKVQQLTNNTTVVKALYYTTDKYPYSFAFSRDILNSAGGSVVKITNAKYLYTKTTLADDYYFLDSVTNLDAMLYATTQTELTVGKFSARNTVAFKDFDRTNTSIMGIYVVPYVSFDKSNATFVEGYNLIKPNNWNTLQQVGSKTLTSYWATTIGNESESKLLSPEFCETLVKYQGNTLFNINPCYMVAGQHDVALKAHFSQNNPQYISYYITITNYNFLSTYDQNAYVPTKYIVPLFTNEWNDYVRNGFNYDVSERERSKKLSIINATISGISAVSSLATSALSVGSNISGFINQSRRYSLLQGIDSSVKKPSLVKGENGNIIDSVSSMVVNQGLGSVGSMINSINAIDSANKSYQHNLNNRASSKTSLNGDNSDYELANDNQLSIQVWVPEDYVLENIKKVFHLTGYNHPVIEMPNTTSRYWFNYLQCSPVFTQDTLNELSKPIIDDLINKYENGVTIFHYHDGYDLDQNKENMEVSLNGD